MYTSFKPLLYTGSNYSKAAHMRVLFGPVAVIIVLIALIVYLV